MKSSLSVLCVLLLSLALVACGSDEPASADNATGVAETTRVAPNAQAVRMQGLRAMSADALRTSMKKASDANRLYAPAGDNVFEYLLALRDKLPGDVGITSQLIDASPMLVAATEKAIEDNDFREADRLTGLLRLADPKNPAVTALTSHRDERQRKIERGRVAAEAERKKIAAEAAKPKAPKVESPKPLPMPAASPSPEPPPQATTDPTRGTPGVSVAPPPREMAADLRRVYTPEPSYPRDALAAGIEGNVLVEMTVGRDGSVIAARVVRATPQGAFEKEVLNTVKRWRFAAVSSPITVRQSFRFNMAD